MCVCSIKTKMFSFLHDLDWRLQAQGEDLVRILLAEGDPEEVVRVLCSLVKDAEKRVFIEISTYLFV